MNKRAWWIIGIVVSAAGVRPAAAMTLGDVQKQIESKLDKVKSVSARLVLEQNIEVEGVRRVGRTEGTYEIVNRGMQSPFRSDMRMKETLYAPGGKTQSRETSVLTVSDGGKYVYVLQDEGGKKAAQKMLMDPKWALFGDRRFLSVLANDFDLSLGKDDSVDGAATWVIEATPKDPKRAGLLRTDHYFRKDTGLWVKAVSKQQDGKALMTTHVSDIKLNVDIPSERFEFKPPPGVTVTDMTTPPPPGGRPPPGAAGKP